MRKSSVKRTFRIDSVLARQLDERASSRRITRTDIVEAALASLLTPDHEERLEAVLTRRLDRLSRRACGGLRTGAAAIAPSSRFDRARGSTAPHVGVRPRRRAAVRVDCVRRDGAGPDLPGSLS